MDPQPGDPLIAEGIALEGEPCRWRSAVTVNGMGFVCVYATPDLLSWKEAADVVGTSWLLGGLHGFSTVSV